MAFLPLAIYTSKLNPRIRAQSGLFLAYNLYAEPSLNGDYDYLSLERIQDYYLKWSKSYLAISSESVIIKSIYITKVKALNRRFVAFGERSGHTGEVYFA